MNIQSINTNTILNNVNMNKIDANESNGSDFSKYISDAIGKVNDMQITSDKNIESLIKGEDVNMHDVMLSMQESQLSMQLLIEVRNKIVEAYQEVNKVQL